MEKILKIFIIICIYMCACSVSVFAGFNDIDGHWCEKEILNFYESEFVVGYDDGSFKPDNEISKAELCKIINAYMNYEVSGDWNTGNMITAKTEGYLLNGNASDFISREEAFVVLARAMKLDAFEYDLTFIDTNEISAWAMPYIKTLVSLEYVMGYETNELKPKQNITRAEVVKVLHDFVGIGGLDEEIEDVEFKVGYLNHNNYGLEFVEIEEEIEFCSGETVMLATTIIEEDVKFSIEHGEGFVEFSEENLILELIESGEVIINVETSVEKKNIKLVIK